MILCVSRSDLFPTDINYVGTGDDVSAATIEQYIERTEHV